MLNLILSAIGYYFGGPIGAMIGSMIANEIDPQRVEGPRLTDLRQHGSEYGRPIPIIFGTVGVQGNVIWQMPLIEVENTDQECGGPEVVTYTYFANFAILFAEGEYNVLKMWAGHNRRPIFDGMLTEGNGVVRIYRGTEDQLPDSLIESDKGIGNVSAHRGYCYVVFEMFPVAKDGNQIPIITAELSRAGTTEVSPPVVAGEFWPFGAFTYGSSVVIFYAGTGSGIIVEALSDEHELVDHFSSEVAITVNNNYTFDESRGVLFWAGIAFGMEFATLNVTTGVSDTHTFSLPVGHDTDPAPVQVNLRYTCMHQDTYIFMPWEGAMTLHGIDPDTLEAVWCYTYATPGVAFQPRRLLAPADAGADWLWMVGYEYIFQLPLDSAGDAVAFALSPLAGNVFSQFHCLVDPVTGYLWVLVNQYGTNNFQMRVYDPVAGLLFDTVTDLTGIASFGPVGLLYTPEIPGTRPARIWAYGNAYIGLDFFMGYNAENGGVDFMETGDYHGLHDITAAAYDPVRDVVMFYREHHFGTGFGSETLPGFTDSIKPVEPFQWVLGGGANASSTPAGSPLDEVVQELCMMGDLSEPQINVLQLADDVVDGYIISKQMEVREAIQGLTPIYYFDGVESAGVAKFVKRGGAPYVTIPEEHLGARIKGTNADVDPLMVGRKMDDELPRLIDVNYMNRNQIYAKANKKAQRQIAPKGTIYNIDIPVVLTDTKAMEVAEVNLHRAWVERRTYKFDLPAHLYAELEPTDVVIVRGLGMRLIKTTMTGHTLECEAVHDDSSTWQPYVLVTETPPPDITIPVATATILELM
jgi:hypothetical protein